MSKIQEKLAQACQAYTNALQTLATAREAYEGGTGKAYTALRAQQEDLRAKILQHQSAADTAQATFKRLFAQAGHAVTKEVKSALFLKNDALSIAEELSVALSESEGASFESMFTASRDAQVYEAAFDQAFEAYVRQEIYQALADCEERMGRALALAQHLPLPDGREKVAVNVTEARMGFVWSELKALAQDRPEAQRRPAVGELGTLDLGPFADRNFVSPVKASQTRKLQRMSAGERDDAPSESESVTTGTAAAT